MKRFACMLVLLSLVCPVFAAPESAAVYDRKDPFLAAAFSWFIPGLGQVYSARPAKGAAFWLTDKVLFWGALFSVADIDFRIERDIGVSMSLKFRDSLSTGRLVAGIGMGLAFAVFRVFNAFDASRDAMRYNLASAGARGGLGFDIDASGRYCMEYELRF